MKKIILGVIIIIVLAAIIAVIVSRFGSGLQPGSASAPSAASSTAAAPTQIYQMPTSTMLTLGTPYGSVKMKNFYLSSLGAEEQFIVLAQNGNYEITYDPAANQFYIYVVQMPYDANRVQAESDLLSRLGIGKADACKLTVGPTGLSFCGSGVIQ
jgi:hypothetical protein